MPGGFILIGALAALLIAPPPPDVADVGPRVAAAMAAAQNLQGPLDGSWLLRDAAGHPLYRFEIVDPAGGRGPLIGAWQDLRDGAHGVDTGFIATLRRGGQSLQLEFSSDGGRSTTLRLTRRSPGVWSGRLIEGGGAQSVVLRRN